MKKLEFKIDIEAGKKKVWDTMLNPKTYREWVNVSWPSAYFDGIWKQGEEIKFLSAGGGGTLTTLAEYRPHEFLLIKHIAVLNADGSEDRDSDLAKTWIGTTESYTFTENNKKTEVKVVINTNPEWEKMSAEGWPDALKKLKEISEA